MSFHIENLLNLGTWEKIIHTYFSGGNMFINILDILVVWYLIYKLIMLIRGTKAIQLLKGITIILVIRIVSGWVGLNTVSWLMNQVITYGVIAIIIIFQPEVRRGLEHLGRSSFFTKSNVKNRHQEPFLQAMDKAIQYMSKRKIGALITIERRTGLDEYIETGIPLDADITGELLINIFIPNTPLHDGAVIIKDGKVAVACAYLPLSESDTLSKEFGTRHRAALGISEVSDAITVIVSEETGEVSISSNGKIYTHLHQDDYLDKLSESLVEEADKLNLFQQFMDGVSRGAKK